MDTVRFSKIIYIGSYIAHFSEYIWHFIYIWLFMASYTWHYFVVIYMRRKCHIYIYDSKTRLIYMTWSLLIWHCIYMCIYIWQPTKHVMCVCMTFCIYMTKTGQSYIWRVIHTHTWRVTTQTRCNIYRVFHKEWEKVLRFFLEEFSLKIGI